MARLMVCLIVAGLLSGCVSVSDYEPAEPTVGVKDGHRLLRLDAQIPEDRYEATRDLVGEALDAGVSDGKRRATFWQCCALTGCYPTSHCPPELPPNCTCGNVDVCTNCVCEPCN